MALNKTNPAPILVSILSALLLFHRKLELTLTYCGQLSGMAKFQNYTYEIREMMHFLLGFEGYISARKLTT